MKPEQEAPSGDRTPRSVEPGLHEPLTGAHPTGPAAGSAPRPDSILRNVTWLGMGSAAVSPLWFFFISYLCIRNLSPDAYGVMNWALWLMMIAASTTDLGLNDFVTREVARSRDQAWRYFSNFVVLRGGLGMIVVGLVAGVAFLGGVAEERFAALMLAGVYALSVYLLSFCRVFFRAFNVLRYESISLILEKLLVLIGGSIGLFATRTAAGTLAGMTAGMLVALSGTLWFVIYRIAPFEFGVIRLPFLKKHLRRAAPLSLFAVGVIVFSRIGPVTLDFFEGAAAVGRYGAAYRIVEAMLLLPALATAALLPRLAPSWASGEFIEFGRLVNKAMITIGIVSGALAIGLVAGGPVLMDWIVKDPIAYAGSGTMLQILGIGYPAMCLNTLLAIVLIAADEQRFLGRFTTLMTASATLLFLVGIWQFAEWGLLGVYVSVSIGTTIALWMRFRAILPAPATV